MNNEFEYEKLKDYENKIVKEFGFNSNWEESYYGSYYFCMNQKTNKLDFLYIVSDHEYFNEITKIDGVLKISLNNNKVELEEVDKEAYNKKLCLPATYLMENFYKKIYKPNYQWYLPENNKTLKAYFKKILVLAKSKELKYFYVNNIEKYGSYLQDANIIRRDIEKLENEKKNIEKEIQDKKRLIWKAQSKLNNSIKKFYFDKEEENTK